jgi:hypothetical protein
MKITVTKRHIEVGAKNSAAYCPVAIAIKEHVNKRWVYVGTRYAEVADWWYILPLKVREFVIAFDGGKKAKPFYFVMRRQGRVF